MSQAASGGEGGGSAEKEAAFSAQTAGSGGSLLVDRQLTIGKIGLLYSCATHAGNDPGGMQKDNQDSWLVKEQMGGHGIAFFGVFDGHGYEGGKVSQEIVRKLPANITATAAFSAKDYQEAFRTAFPETNVNLKDNARIDCTLSGSTGITCLFHGDDDILVGNVGDSRCVVGGIDSAGALYTKPLSNDHKPTVDEEAERIESSGGRITPYMYEGQPIGPSRVWLKEEDMPGLCMTRSFGDEVAASVGVIAEPELTSFKIKSTDKYLLLMSDGIFEFMEDDKVIDLVHTWQKSGATPREISRKLVREARRQWHEEEEDVVDDCTVIVIFLTKND